MPTRLRRTLPLALLLAAQAAFGQSDRYVQIAARYMTSRLYYEAAAVPGTEGTMLTVSFRIPNDLLVFMKSSETDPGKEYVSEVVVTVEVYREQTKVAEEIWLGTHYAGTYEQTTERTLDVQGSVEFSLEPGSYAYRLRVSDRNSDRESTFPLRRVRLPDFSAPAIGRAMVAYEVDVDTVQHGLTIRLANLGGDVSYGKPAFAVFPVTLPPGVGPDEASLELEMQKLDEVALAKESRERMRSLERARRARRDEQPTLEPERMMEGGEIVALGASTGSPMWVAITPLDNEGVAPGQLHFRTSSAAQTYLAVVDLDGRTLADGTYVLKAGLKGIEGAAEPTRFGTQWRDMPISLNDLDVAIENLGFILARNEVRDMRRGSREEKLERLQSFWREKDPTPDTEYNELMAEYYRRVDHAAFAYRTGAQPLPDGLKTDRAKIYVVNGPPLSVSRDFPSGGGVREIWTYPEGRAFVFESDSSVDEFTLVKS